MIQFDFNDSTGDKRLLTLVEYQETRKPIVFSFLINSPRPVGSNFTRRKANSKSFSSEARCRVLHTLTSQIPPFLPKVGKIALNVLISCKIKRDLSFGFPMRIIDVLRGKMRESDSRCWFTITQLSLVAICMIDLRASRAFSSSFVSFSFIHRYLWETLRSRSRSGWLKKRNLFGCRGIGINYFSDFSM